MNSLLLATGASAQPNLEEQGWLAFDRGALPYGSIRAAKAQLPGIVAIIRLCYFLRIISIVAYLKRPVNEKSAHLVEFLC
jgi:hypothetical protein